jgi:hypothetical protein
MSGGLRGVATPPQQIGDERISTRCQDRAAPIRFKQIYFAANWAKYENAVPGTIRIVPNEQLRKVLRDDYVQMKEMLPVDALTFDQILGNLDTLEKRLNSLVAIAR